MKLNITNVCIKKYFSIKIFKNYFLDAISFKSSTCRSEFLATEETQANVELVANPKAPETNKTSGLEYGLLNAVKENIIVPIEKTAPEILIKSVTKPILDFFLNASSICAFILIKTSFLLI